VSHDLEDVGGVAVFPQAPGDPAIHRDAGDGGDERVLVFDGEQRS